MTPYLFVLFLMLWSNQHLVVAETDSDLPDYCSPPSPFTWSNGDGPNAGGVCFSSQMSQCYPGECVELQMALATGACYDELYESSQLTTTSTLSSGTHTIHIVPAYNNWAITTFQLNNAGIGGVAMQACNGGIQVLSWVNGGNTCNPTTYYQNDIFAGLHAWTIIYEDPKRGKGYVEFQINNNTVASWDNSDGCIPPGGQLALEINLTSPQNGYCNVPVGPAGGHAGAVLCPHQNGAFAAITPN
eukprot:TRINITY_DN1141_c0_g1_i4.p1 TRINITY_DN1141_c0_g1~~TRINITY_DN1141_c0_g1_i4.p1  ORF type:complete len:244 (-),score=32.92 TRINITY_DN1141_c0_g1_i4:141-872(-)